MSNTTAYALLVRPDGFIELMAWPADDKTTLQTLYTAIGCRAVDVVDITPDLSMWIDDEGLLADKPQENIPASLIYNHYGTPPQPYFGSAVFTGGTDKNGDTLGLTESAALELIQNVLDILEKILSIPAQRTK
ncbi:MULTISPECIES: DUF3846 domain-containing protein [unclassified Streptomyces]|uniref:DUF3846 domain-containing protein n=1 Tax=unclassified Streptomyces TaxID=2593676 RepID=UPI0035DA6850